MTQQAFNEYYSNIWKGCYNVAVCFLISYDFYVNMPDAKRRLYDFNALLVEDLRYFVRKWNNASDLYKSTYEDKISALIVLLDQKEVLGLITSYRNEERIENAEQRLFF